MPNWCNFKMHVKGHKKDILKFVKVMTDNDQPKHFWRTDIYEAYYIDKDSNRTIANIEGYCAHSVYVCMCAGEHTYHDDIPEESTSLQEESKRLNLEIECYSEEIGVGFMEHYHYLNGEELINEEYRYHTVHPDNWEEYLSVYTVNEGDYKINDDGSYVVGGFDWNFSF